MTLFYPVPKLNNYPITSLLLSSNSFIEANIVNSEHVSLILKCYHYYGTFLICFITFTNIYSIAVLIELFHCGPHQQ